MPPMISLDEFSANFDQRPVPPALATLLAFQNQAPGYYSECFELLVDDKGGLKSWSEDPAFLERLLPFAQANGSGSFYALWVEGDSADTSAMPVVVFGDEGGVHLVAEDVGGLLQILGFDAEPMIDLDEVTYYRPDDALDNERRADYVAWLSRELGLAPASDPAALVSAAQARHKAAFDAWFGQYVGG